MKKFLNVTIIMALLITFIPFGNFFTPSIHAKTIDTEVEEIESEVLQTTGERLELIDKRTEVSKTFLNTDGTYTTEITQAPQHFMNEQENWLEIDNTLVLDPTENNKITNKANSFSVKFDSEIDSTTEGMVISEDNYEIKLNLNELTTNTNDTIGSLPSIGEVNDNTVIYNELFDSISTEYTVGENYVKEDIILHEPLESGLPEKFSYQFSLDNLTYEVVEKQIYLSDSSTGEVKYVIHAPYMYDSYRPEQFQTSTIAESIPEEAKSFDIELETREENGQLFVDLIPNRTWLQDEKRIYPIVIDPTVTRVQGNDLMTDTTLRSQFPSQVGGNDTELAVGRATYNIVRSLLKFDLSAISGASHVLSADLNLYLSSTNSNDSLDITAHDVTKAWNENEANWLNSATNKSWNIAGGDYNTIIEGTANNISTIPTNVEDGLVKWALFPLYVYRWLYDPSSNNGLLLKSTNEENINYKKFFSSESLVDTKYKPKLVVTYKTMASLGLEDYWDYNTHALTDGTNYVNLGTSNNIVQYSDFSLMNYADFGLDFTRTYNSKNFEKSAFGYGWTFIGNQKLFIDTKASGTGNENNIDYQDGDGTVHVFTKTGETYNAPLGFEGTLIKIDNNNYEIRYKDGTKDKFRILTNVTDTPVQLAYITQQTDINNNSIYYEYDSMDQLTTIETDLGTKISLEYRNGVIIKATSGDKVIEYSYSGKHYLLSVAIKKSDTETVVTNFRYNSNNALISIEDPNKNSTDFKYHDDQPGKGLAYVKEPSLTDESSSTTYYTFNYSDLTASTTSPEGVYTKYLLNSNYVVTQLETSDEITTNYELDENYRVLSENTTYADGQTYKKEYQYDTQGNLEKVTDSDGIIYSYEYDTKGNLLSEIDPSGNKTSYTYDSYNRLLSTKSANGEETFYGYTSKGDLETITYPTGNVETYTNNYSDSRKITTHKDSTLQATTESVYDFNGNLLSFKDGKGNITTYHYNLKNELVSVVDASGNTTNFSYDGNGNLINAENAARQNMKLVYTSQNTVEQEINALGQTTDYYYDADGNLNKIKKADKQVISYVQDEENQTSTVRIDDNLQFTTVNNGLTTTVTNNGFNKQTTTYTTSENGALESIQFDHLNKNKIIYGYNNDLLASINYGASSFGYNYNINGQLEELLRNDKSLASFDYNANGLETTTSYGNDYSKIKTNYNGTSNYLESEEFFTNNVVTPWKTNAYTYDKNGQIIGVANQSGTTNYEYDSINQITKETLVDGSSISYEYDSVGNRTKKTAASEISYTYNKANQLTEVDSQTYTYDENSNLTNDGKYDYTWNAFDQLTEVKTVDGTIVGTYKYDENGRRIYSKIGTTETYFRYDGTSNHVLFEEDANGAITKEYMYDNNGHPLTLTYNNQTYYYLTNYRGDVLALTDANGEVVAEYTYDAWGNILTQSGAIAPVNPYRYAGYRFDDETKLYYLIARYYNPDTGVFLSLDSVRGDVTNPISMNGYNYANNNPVMMVDSDGEWAQYVVTGAYFVYKIYKINKKTKKVTKSTTKINIKSSTKWADPKKLQDHYERHGKPFNAVDAYDYAMKANKFYKNRHKYEIDVDKKGIIRVYDKDTNTFGSYNKDGTTKTFFKPGPKDYWKRKNWK